MTYRLAIELGETHLRAALADDREVRLVPISDDPGGLAAVVHVAGDGQTTVGPDALAAEGGEFIVDALDRLGSDDAALPLVAALLADMVRRATENQGEAPELVMIAHPDRWRLAQTAALANAAADAHIDPVVLCSVGAAADAFGRAGGNDQALAVPVGAAILAAVRPDLSQGTIDVADDAAVPPPIVTLEDLRGEAPDPERPVFAYSYSSENPSTVFDADPATYEAQPEEEPASTIPPIVPLQPELVVPAAPPADGRDARTMVALWVVFGLVVGAIVAFAVLLLRDGDDNNVVTPPDSTTSTAVTTTTTPTSTTAPTTTTGATTTVAVTTTAAATTTTEATTTTVTPTTTVTSTTGQPPVTRPATLPRTADAELTPESAFVFTVGNEDLVTVALGDDEGPSVAAFTDALGEPTDDSGWGTDPTCPDDLSVRYVAYGNLVTIYVDRGGAGTIFEGWRLKDEMPWTYNIRTENDLGLGSTEADILDVFPDLEPFAWDDSGALGYTLPADADASAIQVALTGAGGAEKVTFMASDDQPCPIG